MADFGLTLVVTGKTCLASSTDGVKLMFRPSSSQALKEEEAAAAAMREAARAAVVVMAALLPAVV